jgi:hypothetical protein
MTPFMVTSLTPSRADSILSRLNRSSCISCLPTRRTLTAPPEDHGVDRLTSQNSFTIDPGATTSETLLIALAGGAIGAILTGLTWLIVRLASVPGDLRAHDYAVRVLNEDVELWVADTYRDLEQELRRISNTQGLHIEDGSHLNARSAAKTQTLHLWRDRLHNAERDLVVVTHDVVPARRAELRAVDGRESRVVG